MLPMPSKIRCNLTQKAALIDYMCGHRQLARHEYDEATAQREWCRLADTLNQVGPAKTVEKWKITWRDIKRKAIKEMRQNNTSEMAFKIQEILMSDDVNVQETVSLAQHSAIPFTPVDSYQDLERGEDQNQLLEEEVSNDLEATECTPDFSSDSSSSIPKMNKVRCNQDQIRTLVDCMALNPGMAFSAQSTPKKIADWKRLRQLLNRMGPARRTRAWQHTWRDLKRSALEKHNTHSKGNSEIAEKIIQIIEKHAQGTNSPNHKPANDLHLRLPSNIKCMTERNNTQGNSEKDLEEDLSPGQRDAEKLVPKQRSRQLRIWRSSNKQIFALMDYMEKNPALAVAQYISDTQCPYAEEWRRLSLYLNKLGTSKKSTLSWKRTWRDLKISAKKEATNERPSEIYQRINKILENTAQEDVKNMENIEFLDALLFAADFEQMSPGQMSPGQPSGQPLVEIEKGSDPNIQLKMRKKSRFTTAQKHALVDYMSTHPVLASSKYIAMNGDPHNAEWRLLSKYLNKIGTAKSTYAWKRAWRDLKQTVIKKKMADKTLLEIDKKILKISEQDLTELNIEMSLLLEQEFDSLPDPTDGMPVLYSQSQPDVILCGSHGDPAKTDSQEHYRQESCSTQAQESRGKDMEDVEMSPGQRSREVSPGQRSIETRSSRDSTVRRVNGRKRIVLNKRRVRCTLAQINAFVVYMSRHPSLARAKSVGQDSHDEWLRLCRYLNSIDTTVAPKGVQKWKTTWRTLVLNARNKDLKKSKWYERICRKILQIVNEKKPDAKEKRVEKDVPQTNKDCIFYPPPPSQNVFDPLKCELSEDIEHIRKENVLRKMYIRRRSSNLQLRALADFIISHPELATERLSENMPAWVKITRHLNSLGLAKTVHEWCKTWADLKWRLRCKGPIICLEDFREKKLQKILGITRRDPTERDLSSESDEEIQNAHLEKSYVNDTSRRKQKGGSGRFGFRKEKRQFLGKSRRDPIEDVLSSESDEETAQEYSTKPKPVPEVTVTPRAPSPRTVLYNMAEILARNNPMNENNRETNNKKSTTETSASNETNDILRELVLELKRSNELKTEQNCYLKDIAQHLKVPKSTHTNQNAEDTHTDSNADNNGVIEIPKQEEDAEDIQTVNEENNGITDDEMPAESAPPVPVIRPVALSSLTTINTPGQQYKQLKIQSIVRTDPRNINRRLIQLKDGRMLLMPTKVQTQEKPNQDKNADQLYVLCPRKRR
ncbi:uncharacterized protein LOC125238461 isoform X2 [Leguminivora glycinivorella]|uniref:uncharacterized protein LOC125238461 isoform X2 n=1 Tax=Leguminivora glycinivorella TaxID=1035111 RepID=UPI00200DA369|nr:uncharacterized protein LOC125238461 isoform X2 [Leguminivora glycinivorella]